MRYGFPTQLCFCKAWAGMKDSHVHLMLTAAQAPWEGSALSASQLR